MLKVTKFGGSSLCDSAGFARVREIVLADPARRVVVVSAAGKRHAADHKITDLLYLCHAHLQYEVSCWDLWRNIAAQDPSFGHPEKFCGDTARSNWESATVTTLDNRIPPYIEAICKRDPFSGRVVTGGIVTVKDSSWLMSWTINRQPHFKAQPKDQLVVWVYGLYTDRPGDFIKKPMRECTGIEITEEWLYHLGVPEDQIYDMAVKSAHCVPCMMPLKTLAVPSVTIMAGRRRKLTKKPLNMPRTAPMTMAISMGSRTLP